MPDTALSNHLPEGGKPRSNSRQAYQAVDALPHVYGFRRNIHRQPCANQHVSSTAMARRRLSLSNPGRRTSRRVPSSNSIGAISAYFGSVVIGAGDAPVGLETVCATTGIRVIGWAGLSCSLRLQYSRASRDNPCWRAQADRDCPLLPQRRISRSQRARFSARSSIRYISTLACHRFAPN